MNFPKVRKLDLLAYLSFCCSQWDKINIGCHYFLDCVGESRLDPKRVTLIWFDCKSLSIHLLIYLMVDIWCSFHCLQVRGIFGIKRKIILNKNFFHQEKQHQWVTEHWFKSIWKNCFWKPKGVCICAMKIQKYYWRFDRSGGLEI
jgi:hypothetical protein